MLCALEVSDLTVQVSLPAVPRQGELMDLQVPQASGIYIVAHVTWVVRDRSGRRNLTEELEPDVIVRLEAA